MVHNKSTCVAEANVYPQVTRSTGGEQIFMECYLGYTTFLNSKHVSVLAVTGPKLCQRSAIKCLAVVTTDAPNRNISFNCQLDIGDTTLH